MGVDVTAHIDIILDEKVPVEIVKVLDYITADFYDSQHIDKKIPFDELPDHSLFKILRYEDDEKYEWVRNPDYFIGNGKAYRPGLYGSNESFQSIIVKSNDGQCEYHTYSGRYKYHIEIEARASYLNKVGLFLDWIMPYVDKSYHNELDGYPLCEYYTDCADYPFSTVFKIFYGQDPDHSHAGEPEGQDLDYGEAVIPSMIRQLEKDNEEERTAREAEAEYRRNIQITGNGNNQVVKLKEFKPGVPIIAQLEGEYLND